MTCQKALDTYSEISEYEPKELPIRPTDLDTFYALPKERQFQARDDFFRQELIREYLEEKWLVELYNRDCFLRLYELWRESKEEIRPKIEEKMNNFFRVIKENKHPYQSLMLDFKNFELPKVINQKAEAVAAIFGGKVLDEWEE